MRKVVRFEKEKVTKNTVRFQEITESGSPPVMNTLYLQKWIVGNADKVTVTIDIDGGSSDSAKI
jgi:hypothetical protein